MILIVHNVHRTSLKFDTFTTNMISKISFHKYLINTGMISHVAIDFMLFYDNIFLLIMMLFSSDK